MKPKVLMLLVGFVLGIIIAILLFGKPTPAPVDLNIKPSFVLEVVGTPVDGLYDYCKSPATPAPSISYNDSGQLAVQLTPVAEGNDWFDTPARTPPTSLPTPDIKTVNFELVKDSNFDPDNFHVVLVPVGYKASRVDPEMQKIINDLRSRFKGVNIDFAYIDSPIDVALDYSGVTVIPRNIDNLQNLLQRVKTEKHYPADSLALALMTNQFLGSSVENYNFAIFTPNNPLGWFVATHEIGHQMGMNDGYQFYYPNKLPSKELFFADSMPAGLSVSLKELGKIPPVYLMGTCNGKNVYQFYETVNNIYGDYDFDQKIPHSWGDTTFTPLQIIEMNDFVRNLRGN